MARLPAGIAIEYIRAGQLAEYDHSDENNQHYWRVLRLDAVVLLRLEEGGFSVGYPVNRAMRACGLCILDTKAGEPIFLVGEPIFMDHAIKLDWKPPSPAGPEES